LESTKYGRRILEIYGIEERDLTDMKSFYEQSSSGVGDSGHSGKRRCTIKLIEKGEKRQNG